MVLTVACTLATALSAQADVIQEAGIRINFAGSLTPTRLPRHGTAPVKVDVAAKIGPSAGAPPPLLRRIEIAINRNGHFDPTGLPICEMRDIQPTTNADALAACGRSLVGEGQFSAQVDITGQAPYPSRGKLLAFNGTVGCSASERRLQFEVSHPRPGRGWPSRSRTHEGRPRRLISRLDVSASNSSSGWLWPSSSRTQGARQGERTPVRDPLAGDRGQRDAKCHSQPAILAHVYGTKPVPTSYTLPFLIKPGKGTFGTVLEADLPEASANSNYVTGISLDLGRSFRYRGAAHSYLSASCPAPKGFPGAVFPFAKASFAFAGRTLTSTLTRSCRAGG